ncbi:unnamed protein product [Prunus brigantina]
MDQLLPIIACLGWSMLGLAHCRPCQLSGYWEEVGDLDDLLAGRSVMPNLPQRERLLPSLQEMKLLLRR